ncbi:hypothetical protein QEZ54_13925 [Catellatospora sp. KI3]|uniref:hypothetical protein n=1 Tax=Catellatospora sp. KI3 TaxID=3041620 RepID=UPI0024822104|nr:hypothetical protein [Catellatospora sp. KI3]MDI1462068.1 hypothetical protein [Catellatospora sp. KI3]
MGITGTPVRRATFAAVATPAAVLLATGVFGLLAPGDGHAAERGKHHGYGSHSPSPRPPHSPSASLSPDDSPSPSRPRPHSPSPSLSAHGQSPWPSQTPRGNDDGDDGGDDDDGRGHDGDSEGGELPRTGTSGPSTGTLATIGSTVLLGGAGALWLAALLNRRGGERPHPAGRSPRPRR